MSDSNRENQQAALTSNQQLLQWLRTSARIRRDNDGDDSYAAAQLDAAAIEIERLRELQEAALALDDAVAEFGIDKPEYIAEVYQKFHNVLHDGHGSPAAPETAAPETSSNPFDRAAIMGDPGNRRISMSFENQEHYEAALVFLDMADSPEETTEVYIQEALDAAHAQTRERLSKLKVEDPPENGLANGGNK